MSVESQRVRLVPHNAFLETTGIQPRDLAELAPALESARAEVLQADRSLFESGHPAPPEKRPLDAGFLTLPERLLRDYEQNRKTSELGRVLATAQRLRDQVDRVVVLGIGGSYMGARALMDACCQPYFNELSRAARGGWPRMYFQGNNVDNDATQGLLTLLESGAIRGGSPTPVEDAWAIIVISKSGETLETAVAFRQFLAALRRSCRTADELAARVVPVTGRESRLHQLTQALGCTGYFPVPNGVGGRFSVLSSVGLLPAAVLGLDVVALLQGAVAMNEHFASAAPGENPVLDYVGLCHLYESRRAHTIRVLSVWSTALEAVGLWYDQLLAESLGKAEQGASPITTVNTRDLHSRAQQHQEGRRDKLITNLIVDRWRTDPLAVGSSEHNQDRLNRFADKRLPDIIEAAIEGTNQAYRSDGRPTMNIHLPEVNEFGLGQFFQMMMLATVVEGRLIGVNPYGQPGVEAYKKNMIAILEQSSRDQP